MSKGRQDILGLSYCLFPIDPGERRERRDREKARRGLSQLTKMVMEVGKCKVWQIFDSKYGIAARTNLLFILRPSVIKSATHMTLHEWLDLRDVC